MNTNMTGFIVHEPSPDFFGKTCREGEEGFLVPNERAASPIQFSTCWQPYLLHVKFVQRPEVVCIKNCRFPKYRTLMG